MPASAVIPAPIVYTNIAAVKKLVVTDESRLESRRTSVEVHTLRKVDVRRESPQKVVRT